MTTERKEWGIAADLRTLLSFYSKMLSDDVGNVSLKRWVGFLPGTIVPITWAYLCIRNNKVEALPWEIILFVLGAAGIVALGKMGEQKPPPPAPGG